MKVFISWSGERSKALANALRDWLPLVLHYTEPWLSEADIEAGDRWAQSVADELAASNFGIVCVTPENVGAPWVLFEAGALAKTLQTSKVIPLLLDLELSEISGPLAQFQAKKVSESGLRDIVRSIQSSVESSVPDQYAEQLFQALWPQFERKITDIPKDSISARHIRPQQEILEELVASIRAIETRSTRSDEAISELLSNRKDVSKIADSMDQISDFYRIQRRLESTIHELVRDTSRPARFGDQSPVSEFDIDRILRMTEILAPEPGNPLSLVIWASILRMQMPWIYDVSLDIYSKQNARQDYARSARVLRDMLDRAMHIIPIITEEVGVNPSMLAHIFDHIATILKELPTGAAPKS